MVNIPVHLEGIANLCILDCVHGHAGFTKIIEGAG